MARPTRWIINHVALGAVAVGLSLALVLGTARLLSAPGLGEQLSSRHGIPRPAIIAHRGASGLAPESTRPAYLLARELGADYLEVDLQRTRDQVLVVVHDQDLRRTTDVGTVFPDRAGSSVEEFAFAEIQQLDAGSWFNTAFPHAARPSFRGLKILRLEDVLEIAEARSPPAGLYVEPKRPSRFPGIEAQVVRMLQSRGWIRPPPGSAPTSEKTAPRARVVFQSFQDESLARFEALAPQVPRLLLLSERTVQEGAWGAVLDRAAAVATGIGPWGYRHAHGPQWASEADGAPYVTTWPWLTGDAHRAGLLVHAWTIDDAWEMWMLRVGGADGLFTNRPDRAVEIFGLAEPIELEALWASVGY